MDKTHHRGASVKVGLIAPQGWKGEYDGWDPAAAWQRTLELAAQAEELGFESLWVFDHFTTVPDPTDEITFESFSVLAALAMATQRVRLGHMVICTAFRNPALTAKLCSTLDVLSGGRFEVGIGAGWKEDEWLAYGYGFPPIGERIDVFEEHLEVITRMLGAGPRHLRRPARPRPRGHQRAQGHPGPHPAHRGWQRSAPHGWPGHPLRRRAEPRLHRAGGGGAQDGRRARPLRGRGS